jgi:hypothetical protein
MSIVAALLLSFLMSDTAGTNRKRNHEQALPFSIVETVATTRKAIHMSSSGANEMVSTTRPGDDGDDAKVDDAFPFLPLAKLRLEAIFYPKFENENRQVPYSVRQQMKDHCCRAQSGYLEVTLKHSGSLLLWSGGRRYYSKNSLGNKFTAVGEILLRQHFYRAYHHENLSKDNDTNFATTAELMYEKCSAHVQQHRLTLSFEVVTSVLGDHGARPNRDFLILTAIADRSRATAMSTAHDDATTAASPPPPSLFYSTVQLLEFAQQFRLPHNDCWVYTTEPSVDALFDGYDQWRETGTARTVIPQLTRAAALTKSPVNDNDDDDNNSNETLGHQDLIVQSMYPHDVFQGDILEGIVIRFVPCADRKAALSRMALLSRQSREILAAVPPQTPDCGTLMQQYQEQHSTLSISPVLTTDLRKLYADTNVDFEARLLELVPSLCSPVKKTANYIAFVLPTWIKDLQSETSLLENDIETRRVAQVLELLTRLGKSRNAKYSVFHEPSQGSNRFLCIVHVLYDEVFRDFERKKDKDSLPLFRGFSFELLGKNDQFSVSFNGNGSNGSDNCDHTESTNRFHADDDAPHQPLMLKMKLLPYMVSIY